MDKIFIWCFGILVSVGLGHFVTKYTVRGLRRYIGVKAESYKLTATLGCLDRIIFTTLYVLGHYSLIATWFALKIAHRIITPTKIEGEKELGETSERINTFLIGNIASLTFGIIGGMIIKFLLLRH